MVKMTAVNVRFFAGLAERAGRRDVYVEIEQGETGESLFYRLDNEYDFGVPLKTLRLAVNEQFVPMGSKLNSEDVVVFIPPVAGG
jgi:sulfur-carrier protein